MVDGKCTNCNGTGKVETIVDYGYKPTTFDSCEVCDGLGVVETETNKEYYNKKVVKRLKQRLKDARGKLALQRLKDARGKLAFHTTCVHDAKQEVFTLIDEIDKATL